jgi:hypothetical protein
MAVLGGQGGHVAHEIQLGQALGDSQVPAQDDAGREVGEEVVDGLQAARGEHLLDVLFGVRGESHSEERV